MSTAVRFPFFDSFRFVAACLVVACHIEIQKHYLNVPTLISIDTVYEIGKMTVTSFFAMSGFLITHLLLKEKRETGRIHKRFFYIRRGLRIWPLYYLITILAFFILPVFSLGHVPLQSQDLQQHFWPKLLLYLGFLPQFVYLNWLPVPGAEQLWTIGTEEIFYLLWPILLSTSKNPLKLVLTTLAVYLMLKFSAYQLSAYQPDSAGSYFYLFFKILYYNKIECLMLGSLAAVLYNENPDILKKTITSFGSPVFAALTLMGLFASSFWWGPVDYFWYAAGFTWMLTYIGTKLSYPSDKVRKTDRFLGQITFSLYMWHFLVVTMVMNAGIHFKSEILQQTVLYGLTFFLSLMLAVLSYFGIEKFFLNKQKLFRIVK